MEHSLSCECCISIQSMVEENTCSYCEGIEECWEWCGKGLLDTIGKMKAEACYAITNENAVVKVVEVNGNDLEVRLIESSDKADQGFIGELFTVRRDDFVMHHNL